MDEEKAVYNTEMQQKQQSDLARRSRYYQSMLDTSLLEPGVPDYSTLNPSYIIMIAPFDLFGYGRYVYTFRATCQEEPGCILQDGATRIFLNTRGKNDSETSPELISFLHYLENTTDEAAAHTGSERMVRIHQRVQKVKLSEQIGVKYMQAWEERYYDRLEAKEEGRTQGMEEGMDILLLKQIRKKLAKGFTATEIADMLEESEDKIRHMAETIEAHPEMDEKELLEVL